MKIAVVMGGISSEREISIQTGRAVLSALLELGYDAYELILNDGKIIELLMEEEYDLAYIALHGEFGEDGRIQAVLDILKKPYIGSGHTASAIAMDKVFSKKLLMADNVVMPKEYERVEDVDSFPVVVKPSLEGSSFGLYICKNREELNFAGKKLAGRKLVIEEFIDGEELTVGVLNGESLGVVKIIPKSGVYDFESKYIKGQTDFEIPAKIDKELYDRAMKRSEKIYKLMDLAGAVRVDFILRNRKLYFLEVNTIPGMTETSLLPKCASLKGYSFKSLVAAIVEKKLQKV